MSWEEWMLIFALIVLAIDIIWQFVVAGFYAPRKARDLVVKDPLIVDLRGRLDLLDARTIAQFKTLVDTFNRYQGGVSALNSRIQEIAPNLYQRIAGLMGAETAQINAKMDEIVQGDVQQQFDNAFNEGDMKTMENIQEREMRYNTAYALTSQWLSPEKAEAVSGLYATSKPGIRGAITKRIKKYIRGGE